MGSFWVFPRRTRKQQPGGVAEQPTLSLMSTADGHGQRQTQEPGWMWGHLRVLERVGQGSFGDVYRAWDEALTSEFALKLFRAEGAGVAQAISREARLLARIRHQNVCRVYGVASHNGLVGMWMEYIHGQTLSQIVESQGEFAPGEAALAGVSLCGALAEIHRKRVVHGDIKAHNVMREIGGRLLLTDFGVGWDLSAGSEQTERLAGTPMYMAPELLDGQPPTVRSDIYALGVLLFYLVTHSYPVRGATVDEVREAHKAGEVQSLRDVRPDVPEGFVRVVERAISSEPSHRFATPGQMNVALQDFLGKPRLPKLRLIAAAILPLAVYGGWRITEPHLFSPASATLLVGDFDNRTPHADLDLAVREALTMELERSRRHYVFPRSRMLETLELMRRPRDTRIDASVAHDICRREGIPIAVRGEITSKDSGFEISVRVTETEDDSTRAMVKASFGGTHDIGSGISRMAAELRSQLGERRLPLTPLPPVTTHSLEALQRYARGQDHVYRADPDGALSWLLSAIERDSEFAVAYRLLATVYSSLGRHDESLNAATRAFELRGRSSERERHLIEGTFHLRRADYLQAAESYKTVITLFPQDDAAHHQLAQLYILWADYDASISEMRQAVQLHPTSVSHRGLLALLLAMANREDEALREVSAARSVGMQAPFLLWGEAHARLGKGEFGRARDTFHSLRKFGAAWDSAGGLGEAAALILLGDLKSAESELEVGSFSHLRARHPANEAKVRLWLAQLYLLQGEKSRALSQLNLLPGSAPSPANVRSLRAAALILTELGARDAATTMVQQLEEVASQYPSAYTRGIAAQARGKLDHALGRMQYASDELALARSLWSDSLTLWSLARYWEERQDYGRALGLYEEMIARRGLMLNQEFPGIWVLAHLSAGRCERRLGKHAQAAQYYDRFLNLWGNESMGLGLVYEAKQERQSLKSLGF
jgi:serine/threonine-protein kinase